MCNYVGCTFFATDPLPDSGEQTCNYLLANSGERLEVQQLFHNICVGIYVGLAVTAVRSPSKLHIQLKIMQDMMGKLTEAIGNEYEYWS